MSDVNKERILNRIRKMMRLANDAGATEGERDNAMRMVHATLAKYNLEMPDDDKTETVEPRVHLFKDFLGKPWCVSIAGALATLYFTKYYYQTLPGNAGPKQPARHNFVGRQSNATTAMEMAEWIVDAVNKQAQAFGREYGGGYKDYRAFAQGAAEKIFFRCLDLATKSQQKGLDADDSGNSCTAVIVSNLYKKELIANTEFLATKGVKLGKGRSQSYADNAGARAAGRAFGSTVSLTRNFK